jgi:hypothetical protein
VRFLFRLAWGGSAQLNLLFYINILCLIGVTLGGDQPFRGVGPGEG